MQNSIWLTWHQSTRSTNMAKAVNADLYEIFITKNLFLRHFGSSIWTIIKLFELRPKCIFIQYSFLLLIITDLYKIISFGKPKIVVDCHTKALRRRAAWWIDWFFWPIKKLSFKLAEITIVHNAGNIKDIKKLHSQYFVIPDKIPHHHFNIQRKAYPTYCVNISSFDVDEPIEEIIEVAKLLEKDDIKLFWTGKAPTSLIERKDSSTNLILTGYISFEEYFDLIGNADCSMALTREEDCLQSGAYESLDFEIPMVLSDTKALRTYFGDTAVYSPIEPGSLYKSIKTAIDNAEHYKSKMKVLKEIREAEHRKLIAQLNSAINNNLN